MREVKLSRLYWTIVYVWLCVTVVSGHSLCIREYRKLESKVLESLCDLNFCTCNDPYGRVACTCPEKDPYEELILTMEGLCTIPWTTTNLTIINCRKVTVISGALNQAKHLQTVGFINVRDVSVEGKGEMIGFRSDGPPRNILFSNTTIQSLPSFSFTGNISMVEFDNCYIGTIQAFAFSNIRRAESIAFKNTVVANVEVQSFKKFTMNKFLIMGSDFKVIPSRFVIDVTVETLFKIESTFVEEVRTLGFKVFNPMKVIIVESVINRLHGEAFKIITKGEVIIDSNNFRKIDDEAFRGLSVDRYIVQQSGKQKLKFRNITVGSLMDKSLYFNRTIFDVQTSKLMIDEVCTCDGLTQWKHMITIGKKPLDSFEVELEPIWCHLDDRKEGNFDYVPGRQFYKDHCTLLLSSIHFFVLIISVTSVCLALTVITIVCILRHRGKWKPVPTSRRDVARNGHGKVGKPDRKQVPSGNSLSEGETTKAMIVPDGRTYRETEFHIVVEKAEPLDDECIPYTVVRDRSRSQVN